GNVMTNDIQGADGAVMYNFTYTDDQDQQQTTNVFGVPVNTKYGTLTVNSDGSWTYTPNAAIDHSPNGDPVNDNFMYTIIDGDGDTSSATQPIAITNDGGPDAKDDGPEINPDHTIVDEDDLANGSDTNKESLTVSGNVLDNDDIGADGATITSIMFNGVTYR